jgi:putative AbiEii toxin of type IV toxin-antitoxin system
VSTAVSIPVVRHSYTSALADTITLHNIGPIKDATVRFGDLTILVGPQATGKSVFLQLFKLVLDSSTIAKYLGEHGLNWHGNFGEFLSLYLGEGSAPMWHQAESEVQWHGKRFDLMSHIEKARNGTSEKSLFIPAQRVLSFTRDGWFRPFNDYKPGDPYCVRDFSEKMRRLMESDDGHSEGFYPEDRGLVSEVKDLLSQNIFRGFQLELEKTGLQTRLMLGGHGSHLPYMVWSAGQREFVPLFLGFHRLLRRGRRSNQQVFKWVLVEELEMGLHPKGIAAAFFVVLMLLHRGYKVCLSTHSPAVLDLVWAIGLLREHRGDPAKLLSVFDIAATPWTIRIAQTALEKTAKVFYFDSGETRDISGLDPASNELAEAGWGGLTELSGRLADVVAETIASRDRT